MQTKVGYLLALITFSLVLVTPSSMNGRGVADDPAREFSISSDPTEGVIEIAWVSGLTYDHGSFVLYGDGRFVHESHTASGEALGLSEIDVSFDELVGIVTLAVEHGILDVEMDEVESKMADLARSDPARGRLVVTDASTTTIRISLDSYSIDGGKASPINRRYECRGLKVLAKVFPEIQELVGLDRIRHELQELAIRAEGKVAEGG